MTTVTLDKVEYDYMVETLNKYKEYVDTFESIFRKNIFINNIKFN